MVSPFIMAIHNPLLLQKQLPPIPRSDKAGPRKLPRRAMTEPSTNVPKPDPSSSKGAFTAATGFAVRIPDGSYSTHNTQKPLPAMPTGTADGESDDAACRAKLDDPSTKDFQGDLKVNNLPPNKNTLVTAGELPVLDKDGKKLPFKSLYPTNLRQRVLIIFIRHFFCGVCPPSPFRLTASSR